MALTKVLITVVTYPLPSRSYDELICTAGVLETGEWIRIYPVPMKFLMGLRENGKMESFKYTWIELDLKKRTDDFRPESHSPVHYNFNDIIISGKIDTKSNWAERKKYCTVNIYTNLSKLIEDSKAPNNISLATFKPTKIIGLEIIKEESREWKDEWKALRKQTDLFEPDRSPEIQIRKLPYKFLYKFIDDAGKESRLMIEDWEIGQLYWNCLAKYEGNESKALDMVREKYEKKFLKENELFFFLGTTREWHMRRAKNPFVIIGVFYPKKELTGRLF
ncbi:MAG: hypothetical protein LBU62_05690 [Bacteroidales bacterium]|jgi:hypothetical protein|nr:hypothetical protein [Bacteroidales bacterium]